MSAKQDQEIAQVKEMIMAASLTLKSKGDSYDRVAWLLEDIIAEIENLESQSEDSSSSTSYEQVMNYLDKVGSEEVIEQDSKEINQGS